MNITNPAMRKGTALLTGLALAATFLWSGGVVWAATPSVPVVTSPVNGSSTTTSPARISGTAQAGTEVFISGGATPASATVDGSGNWTALVNLTPDSTNVLSLFARNSSSEDSANLTFTITHSSSTSTPDTTPPAAPVITFPTTPYTTSANAVLVTGTAEGNAVITINNGSGPATTTASSTGAWSFYVLLPGATTTTYSFTATDAAGNTSSSTSVVITQIVSGGGGGGSGTTTATSTSTSTPTITVNGDNPISVFECNGFTDPGATALSSAGASLSVNASSTVNLDQPGTYTIVYTTNDASMGSSTASSTATVTRTVTVLACSSGSHHSSGGGSSRPGDNTAPGLSHSQGSVMAGIIIGPSFAVPGIPATAGEVLGASATFQFTSILRMGMSGPEVTELQIRLAETGYFHGPITGYFGPKTRASLIRLQRANGLVATGELDLTTMALLNS